MRNGEERRAQSSRHDIWEALENLTEGVFIVEPHGRMSYANPVAASFLGEERVGCEAAEWLEEGGFFRPDATTPWQWDEFPVSRALAGESSHQIPLFMRNAAQPAGLPLWLSCVPFRLGPDLPGGAVCTLRLNASRSRESLLLDTEERRRAILDNIRDMAWLKDRAGRFIAVNQRSVEMYDRPLERWVGFTDYDVYSQELADRFRADDEVVIRLRRQQSFEERIVDSSGQVRWVETIKSPVFDAAGEVIGTTGTARDITERKQTETDLRANNTELERQVAERTEQLSEAQQSLVRRERLAVLGQLAGGIAHQIRNPLGAIMNVTSVLHHHLRNVQHKDVQELLGIIREEIRHANAIITGLLDFARVRTPVRVPTVISELVDRVIAGQNIPNSVQVQRRYTQVPLLLIDADLIQSALYNLFRNALEAMPEGGTVTVDIFSEARDVIVAVNDTGPGLTPRMKAHLFQPLHSTKPLGLGLGLLTARTFVEAHDGCLVPVDVPQGARFELRLPLR